MKKRILLIAVAAFLLISGGILAWLKSNQDIISSAIAKAVKTATGRELILTVPPSLTVFPNVGLDIENVSWGTDEDQLSVFAEQARIKVALIPLFAKKIEVVDVSLKNPRINLRSESEKKSAVEKQDQGKVESKPEQNNEAAGMDISLASVSITNADILLEFPDMSVNLSKMNLELNDLVQGRQASLTLFTNLNLKQKEQNLHSKLQMTAKLMPKLPLIEIRDLHLESSSIEGLITAPLSLFGNLDFYTANPRAEKIDLILSLLDSSLKLNGQVQFEDLAAQLNFLLNGSLRNILNSVDSSYGHTANSPGIIKLGGNIKMRGQHIEISKLEGTLDNTEIKGSFSADLPDKYSLDLNIGSINLDNYLPGNAASEQKKSEKNTAKDTVKPAVANNVKNKKTNWPELRADIAAKSIVAKNIRVDNLLSRLRGNNGTYALNSTFNFYESKINSTARAELPKEQYRIQLSGDKINATKLLHDAAGLDSINGKINVRADMGATGTNEAAIRSSLDGNARITGQADISLGSLGAEWSSILRNIQTISLSSINLEARANKGQINLKPVNAQGKLVKITGEGTANLPANMLDLRLDTALAGLVVPIHIRGSLDNPSYGIDPGNIITNIIQTPANIIKDGGNVLEDGVKSIGSGAKNLLQKLR